MIVVGFASMTGSAYATHDPAHFIEEIKGGLKSLEGRVWDLEQIDPVPGPAGGAGPSTVFVTSTRHSGNLRAQGWGANGPARTR